MKRCHLALPLLALFACVGASQSAGGPAEPTTSEIPAVAKGFHSVTAVFVVDDVDKAVAYYEATFAGKARATLPGPDGKTMHAEVAFGDSVIMLALANHTQGAKSPITLGGTNGGVMIYVSDVDAVFAAALASGSKQVAPVTDMFWGDRFGELVDPFGHAWAVSTHKEDVSAEDMAKRGQEFGAAMAQGKKPPSYPAGPAAKSFKPDGILTITPSLVLTAGDDVLAFYKNALGATVGSQMPGPDGTIVHAELVIGDSLVMVATESPQRDAGKKAAKALGGSPFQLHMYTDDVDGVMATAKTSHGVVIAPPQDMFWGDYWGLLADPSGNQWGVATHKEDLSPEQMMERLKQQKK